MNNVNVVFREICVIYPTYEFLNSLALLLNYIHFKKKVFNLLSFTTPNFKFDGYEVEFKCVWRLMTLILSALYKSQMLLRK